MQQPHAHGREPPAGRLPWQMIADRSVWVRVLVVVVRKLVLWQHGVSAPCAVRLSLQQHHHVACGVGCNYLAAASTCWSRTIAHNSCPPPYAARCQVLPLTSALQPPLPSPIKSLLVARTRHVAHTAARSHFTRSRCAAACGRVAPRRRRRRQTRSQSRRARGTLPAAA